MVSDPPARRPGAGALLLREFLSGPQDMTITDGATPEVAAIWQRLGGFEPHPRSLVWTRLLRPGGAVRAVLERRGRRALALAVSPLRQLSDAVTRPFARPPTGRELGETEELTPAALLEH